MAAAPAKTKDAFDTQDTPPPEAGKRDSVDVGTEAPQEPTATATADEDDIPHSALYLAEMYDRLADITAAHRALQETHERHARKLEHPPIRKHGESLVRASQKRLKEVDGDLSATKSLFEQHHPDLEGLADEKGEEFDTTEEPADETPAAADATGAEEQPADEPPAGDKGGGQDMGPIEDEAARDNERQKAVKTDDAAQDKEKLVPTKAGPEGKGAKANRRLHHKHLCSACSKAAAVHADKSMLAAGEKRMTKAHSSCVKDAAEFLEDHANEENLTRHQKAAVRYHAKALGEMLAQPGASGSEDAEPELSKDDEEMVLKMVQADRKDTEVLRKDLNQVLGKA